MIKRVNEIYLRFDDLTSLQANCFGVMLSSNLLAHPASGCSTGEMINE